MFIQLRPKPLAQCEQKLSKRERQTKSFIQTATILVNYYLMNQASVQQLSKIHFTSLTDPQGESKGQHCNTDARPGLSA